MSREISPRSKEICFTHAITLGDLAMTGGGELDVVLDRMAVAEARLAESERELDRLRAGGCARDQRATQFCAEAVQAQAEARALSEAAAVLERENERLKVALANAVSERDNLREALSSLAASLAAAISLLERGGKAAKKAAPSDKMFDIMLMDYQRSLAVARMALAAGDARNG